MWAELSISNCYDSNHWKRAPKMIFKGSGCFEFPKAVVTSTATDCGSLQVLAVI